MNYIYNDDTKFENFIVNISLLLLDKIIRVDCY